MGLPNQDYKGRSRIVAIWSHDAAGMKRMAGLQNGLVHLWLAGRGMRGVANVKIGGKEVTQGVGT
jgi:hypothetical protein